MSGRRSSLSGKGSSGGLSVGRRTSDHKDHGRDKSPRREHPAPASVPVPHQDVGITGTLAISGLQAQGLALTGDSVSLIIDASWEKRRAKTQQTPHCAASSHPTFTGTYKFKATSLQANDKKNKISFHIWEKKPPSHSSKRPSSSFVGSCELSLQEAIKGSKAWILKLGGKPGELHCQIHFQESVKKTPTTDVTSKLQTLKQNIQQDQQLVRSVDFKVGDSTIHGHTNNTREWRRRRRGQNDGAADQSPVRGRENSKSPRRGSKSRSRSRDAKSPGRVDPPGRTHRSDSVDQKSPRAETPLSPGRRGNDKHGRRSSKDQIQPPKTASQSLLDQKKTEGFSLKPAKDILAQKTKIDIIAERKKNEAQLKAAQEALKNDYEKRINDIKQAQEESIKQAQNQEKQLRDQVSVLTQQLQSSFLAHEQSKASLQSQLHQIEHSNDTLKSQYNQTKTKLESITSLLQSEEQKLEAAVSRHQSSVNELTTQIQSLHTQSNQTKQTHHIEIQNLNQKLNQHEEKSASDLKEQEKRFQATFDNLTAQLKEAQENKILESGVNLELTKELAATKLAADGKADLERKLKFTDDQYQTAKQTLQQTQTQLKETETKLSGVESAQQSTTQQLTEANNSLSALKFKLEEQQKIIESVNATNEGFKQREQELQNQLNQAQVSTVNLERIRDQYQKNVIEEEKQKEEVQNQLEIEKQKLQTIINQNQVNQKEWEIKIEELKKENQQLKEKQTDHLETITKLEMTNQIYLNRLEELDNDAHSSSGSEDEDHQSHYQDDSSHQPIAKRPISTITEVNPALEFSDGTPIPQASINLDGADSELFVVIEPGSILNYFDSIDMFEPIGEGKFGSVHKCKFDNMKCAVKIVDLTSAEGWEVDEVCNELKIQTSLTSDNLLEVIMAFQEGFRFYIVLPLMAGDLWDYCEDHAPLEPTQLLKFSHQILSGLAYMHQRGICHRDIKLGNVLLEYSSTGPSCKIADFGISFYFTQGLMNENCGTPGYEAIEIWKNPMALPYTEKVDIWAFGVLFWEMATHRQPWDNLYFHQDDPDLHDLSSEQIQDAMLHYFPDGTQNTFAEELLPLIHENFRPLMCLCFQVDANKRISAEDAVKEIESQPHYKK